MKITTDTYTIESDHHGYRLTARLPSENEKSKTGWTEKVTFHANLKQVADKMVSYEIIHADAKDVFALSEAVQKAAETIAERLETLKC
jgi:hypothetical protein